MGIRPTDLPVILPSDMDDIRHVERKSEAHDSERRSSSGREDSERHSRPEEATEDVTGGPGATAHDSVEISAQYQAEQRASRDEITSPSTPSDARPEPPVTVEHHLNIQA